MTEPAVDALLAFDAFVQEHRRCGTIDGSSGRPLYLAELLVFRIDQTTIGSSVRLGSGEVPLTGYWGNEIVLRVWRSSVN